MPSQSPTEKKKCLKCGAALRDGAPSGFCMDCAPMRSFRIRGGQAIGDRFLLAIVELGIKGPHYIAPKDIYITAITLWDGEKENDVKVPLPVHLRKNDTLTLQN